MNKVNVIVKQRIDFDIYNSIELSHLNDTLKNVSPLYPNFDSWLNFSFRRNIPNGERSVLLATDGSNILGISLLKHSLNKNKICTFYIPEEFRGMNIGNELMSKSLSILDSENTIITVSNERIKELQPILSSHQFNLVNSKKSLYRSGVTEHIFSL